MEEYMFLFGLAFIWTIFAVVQDMRTREVSNWLNFSFIGIALAYRALYASTFGDGQFLIFGLMGFGVFYVLAHGLYYSRAFAGGDAKLLMGFGVILPYGDYLDLVLTSLGFVFILFFLGAVWSLVWSVGIVSKNRKKFVLEFGKVLRKWKWIFVVDIGLLLFFLLLFGGRFGFSAGIGFFVLSLFFVYAKSLDKCMVKLVAGRNLQEGDWLEEDVKVKGRVIKKSVHGLSKAEIKVLRGVGRKVLIKEGIPFTPAFLGALLVMVYVFLVLRVLVSDLLVFLF